MYGPTRPLVIIAFVGVSNALCFGVLAALMLVEPIGMIEPALIGARGLTALLALLLAVQSFSTIRLLRRLDVEGELHEHLEQADQVKAAIGRISWTTTAMIWALVASFLISAMQALEDGDVPVVALNLAAAGLLTWLQLRGGGGSGRGRSVGKLLGEKSRALVDQMVEDQKGLRPQPSPIG